VTGPERLDMLRQVLGGRGAAAPGPACLSDDTIAALADGVLDAARRAVAVPHLATCARCRAAVASVARALADPAVAREVSALHHATRRRFPR
jgi:anti-sigma factor RsiW